MRIWTGGRPTLPKRIKTPEDVRQFFRYLLLVDRVSFHPDDSFGGYGHERQRRGGGREWVPAYTRAEAAKRDRLMAKSFEVMDAAGLDIYDLGLRVMEEFGMRFPYGSEGSPEIPKGPEDWSP